MFHFYSINGPSGKKGSDKKQLVLRVVAISINSHKPNKIKLLFQHYLKDLFLELLICMENNLGRI